MLQLEMQLTINTDRYVSLEHKVTQKSKMSSSKNFRHDFTISVLDDSHSLEIISLYKFSKHLPNGCSTVSYTHLDVYKRQQIG